MRIFGKGSTLRTGSDPYRRVGLTFRELQSATTASYADRPTLAVWLDRIAASHPILAATGINAAAYPGDIAPASTGSVTVHFEYPTRPGMRPTPRAFCVGWDRDRIEYAYVS